MVQEPFTPLVHTDWAKTEGLHNDLQTEPEVEHMLTLSFEHEYCNEYELSVTQSEEYTTTLFNEPVQSASVIVVRANKNNYIVLVITQVKGSSTNNLRS